MLELMQDNKESVVNEEPRVDTPNMFASDQDQPTLLQPLRDDADLDSLAQDRRQD